MLDIMWQVIAAGFLASLDQDDASCMRGALFAQPGERGQRPEHPVAIGGAAAGLELCGLPAPGPPPVSNPPADQLRLLVEVTVEQDRIGTLPRHLDQDQRRAPGQPYDVERRTREAGQPLAGPALEHRDRFFHVAVRSPIRVEGRRLVRDPDIIDEGRDDRIAPDLTDELAELRGIEHPTGPCCLRGHAITGRRTGRRRLRAGQWPVNGSGAMILVFGSINIDLLVPVRDLPRPGETVLGGDYRLVPGGKGANQALAASPAAAGGTPAAPGGGGG